MTIEECNPFIRFAGEIVSDQSFLPCVSQDCRLFLITDGAGNIEIDGTTYSINHNSAFLFHSGTPYRIKTDHLLKIIAINFDFSQRFKYLQHPLPLLTGESVKNSYPLENTRFSDFEVLNKPIYLPNATYIATEIHRIVEEKRNIKIGYQALCSSYFKNVLCKIVREKSFVMDDLREKINHVINFIQENYHHNIDNLQISATINYHPYYVNKLMIAYTGMTIHQYLNYYRLSISAYYLHSSTKSINEIAYAVGFSTPAHYIANFKKQYSMTPKAYRDAQRKLI